jgi:hypothetical protein
MIKIEFQTGKVVERPERKDTYELVVGYMHGDADGDTVKNYFYPNSNPTLEELTLDVIGIMALTAAQGDEVENGEIAELFEAQGYASEEAYALAEGFNDDFYEGDITCEGRPAACTGFELYYYDHKGVKHEVNTLVNGRKV